MAGRMTRMAQHERKAVDRLFRRMNDLPGEFGGGAPKIEFTLEVENSLSRYNKLRRENLYAVVMPSGSGKTQLCRKYGFIDIDQCSTPREHELLNSMRIKCIEGTMKWSEHDDYWFKLVNDTLDIMDFSRPTVIMVQTEVIALSIGALPLAGLFPSDELFSLVYKDKVDKGNRAGAILMAQNRKDFLSHSNIMMKSKVQFGSFSRGEDLVIRIMNINAIPVACPYKYSISYKNDWYSEDCPEWVMTGNKEAADMSELLYLYKSQKVPKECLDYFAPYDLVPASYGFGFTMRDWSILMAEMRSRIKQSRNFSLDSDMSELFPYTHEKMVNRCNITMQRLKNGTDIMKDQNVLDIMSTHIGDPNNFVTAVICYWFGKLQYLKSASAVKKLLSISFVYWSDMFKEFHSKIRLSRYFMNTEIDEEERQSLMYLNVLLGKEVAEADWVQEIEDRTCDDPFPDHLSYDATLNSWTRTKYWEDFKLVMDSSYMRFGDRTIEGHTFEEFYKNRASWMTKGSTVANPLSPEDKKYTVDVLNEAINVVSSVTGRHNKKSLFETMHAIGKLDAGFELFNLTKMVTKLDENGHTKRALFPGSLLHYIVVAFVLVAAEKQGQVGNVRLNAPPDDDMAYFGEKMTEGFGKVMFDWMNYNSYHSLDEMALVMERLADVVDAGDQYKKFCILVADSMYQMIFLDPEGEYHKLGKGLYSGWRNTTWVNTVLQNNYRAVAELCFERLYGHTPFRYVDGGGDDMEGGLNRHDDGYKFLLVMNRMKMKGKPIKQMVDTKSEFFRNTMVAGAAYASPARALATFINGKWEGSGNIPITERTGAILDQVGKVVRRGFDKRFGDVLTVICLGHWCKIKGGDDWLSLPPEVLHGSLQCNGLGVPDPDGNVWVLEDRIPDPAIVGEVKNVPGTLASTDYLSVLCRELREYNISVENRTEIEMKMAKASFDVYNEYDYGNVVNFKSKVISKISPVVPIDDKPLFEGLQDYTTLPRDKAMSKAMKVLRYIELLPNMRVGDEEMSVERLMSVFNCSVNPDFINFKGDVYYRRLVSEPIAKVITEYCTDAVAMYGASLPMAEYAFKALCWMCSQAFEIKI